MLPATYRSQFLQVRQALSFSQGYWRQLAASGAFPLGKGEVDSSILSSSTIILLETSAFRSSYLKRAGQGFGAVVLTIGGGRVVDLDRIIHASNCPEVAGDLWTASLSGTAMAIHADTRLVPVLPELDHLREIWFLHVKPETLDRVLKSADPEILRIEGVQTDDLSCLSRLGRVRGLAIEWNTKLESLDCLRPLQRVDTLSLNDMKRIRDLSPIAEIGGLRQLSLAGGMWSDLDLETLAPLAALKDLEVLWIAATRVRDGSLAPLEQLKNLRTLEIANSTASTEEFARLAARLPHVDCDMFRPFVRLDGKPIPRGADLELRARRSRGRGRAGDGKAQADAQRAQGPRSVASLLRHVREAARGGRLISRSWDRRSPGAPRPCRRSRCRRAACGRRHARRPAGRPDCHGCWCSFRYPAPRESLSRRAPARR